MRAISTIPVAGQVGSLVERASALSNCSAHVGTVFVRRGSSRARYASSSRHRRVSEWPELDGVFVDGSLRWSAGREEERTDKRQRSLKNRRTGASANSAGRARSRGWKPAWREGCRVPRDADLSALSRQILARPLASPSSLRAWAGTTGCSSVPDHRVAVFPIYFVKVAGAGIRRTSPPALADDHSVARWSRLVSPLLGEFPPIGGKKRFTAFSWPSASPLLALFLGATGDLNLASWLFLLIMVGVAGATLFTKASGPHIAARARSTGSRLRAPPSDSLRVVLLCSTWRIQIPVCSAPLGPRPHRD